MSGKEVATCRGSRLLRRRLHRLCELEACACLGAGAHPLCFQRVTLTAPPAAFPC